MTRLTLGLVLIAVATSLPSAKSAATGPPSAEFVSPRPGAKFILPETNIIFRPGGVVDPSWDAAALQVIGSRSGAHAGRAELTDDRRTIVFRPDHPFEYSETVTCTIGDGLRTDTHGPVTPSEFTFTVAGPEREQLRDFEIPREQDEELPAGASAPAGAFAPAGSITPADSLPDDFPLIHAEVYGPTAPGRIFLSDLFFQARGPRIPSYLMILENDGTPFFYRRIQGLGTDFKMQPNGWLTWFDSAPVAYYAMDATYAVVDSFRCGNGYSTDNHELQLLPNGHAVLMSYDPQVVDLTAVGGRHDAIVIGLILQELDTAKNVVFQWRSWDHFQVTDMVSHDITAAVVDYVHGNSADVDAEGNFVISSRHMNEVTKISRTTGEILWRLGGKNNQFRFIGDPIPFDHQHDARLLPGGRLTLFDNGTFRFPRFSRAVEYALDETNKTATLVWQYRATPDLFGIALGSVQRLPNGNTLIGWGATTPTLTEITPAGSIVARMTFESGIASYRAFRFEWPPVLPVSVEFNPTNISLNSEGSAELTNESRVRAIIVPQEVAFDAEDVDLSTVRLGGTVPPDTTKNQPDRLEFEFERDQVASLLKAGPNTVEITGSLRNGERFRGTGSLVGLTSEDRPDRGKSDAAASFGAFPIELRAAEPNRPLFIYDVRGRLVRRIDPTSGATARAWDGRDTNGRPVATGIYLIRHGGGKGSSTKVVIVR